MKTAKEWAAEVVVGAECDGVGWAARIEDATASAWFETEPTSDDAQDDADRATAIIGRLVERVQADARALLETSIGYRDDCIESLRDELAAWRTTAARRARALAAIATDLEDLQRIAAPGSAAEDMCERRLPKIEEALR